MISTKFLNFEVYFAGNSTFLGNKCRNRQSMDSLGLKQQVFLNLLC